MNKFEMKHISQHRYFFLIAKKIIADVRATYVTVRQIEVRNWER